MARTEAAGAADCFDPIAEEPIMKEGETTRGRHLEEPTRPPGTLACALTLTMLVGVGQARSGDLRSAPIREGSVHARPCTVALQPDTLTIRQRPARILARLPADLGEPERVRVPPESGLETREIRPDPDGRTWIVGVDLGEAVPGRWTLRFLGSDGACEGVLTTRMPGGDRSTAGPPRFDAGNPDRLGRLARSPASPAAATFGGTAAADRRLLHTLRR